jgi:hypothetical protein
LKASVPSKPGISAAPQRTGRAGGHAVLQPAAALHGVSIGIRGRYPSWPATRHNVGKTVKRTNAKT